MAVAPMPAGHLLPCAVFPTTPGARTRLQTNRIEATDMRSSTCGAVATTAY